MAAQRRVNVLSTQICYSDDITRGDRVKAEGVRLPWSRFPPFQGDAASSTNYRTVKYSVKDGIAIIVRSRPTVLNSVNFQTHCDMIAAFEQAEQDDSVLAAVLTGDGRYFCSGADVAGNPETYDIPDPPRVKEIKAVLCEERRDDFDAGTWPDVNMYDAWINFSKPLIAAVNGPAIGEGFTTLMPVDMVYSSDTAFYWTPFLRWGVVPEITSTTTLAQKVGPSIAAEMLMLSKKKTPEEMMRAGLVNEVIPGGDGFLPAVLERVKAGLELSGDPSVRLKALRMVKSMTKPKEWRDKMMALNRSEQEMVRKRMRAGDTAKNLKYYAASMPQKKK